LGNAINRGKANRLKAAPLPTSRTQHPRDATARHCRIEQLETRELLAADVMISEFVARNGGSLLDGGGESSDWIEVHNAGRTAVDLTGWYLTDNAADLKKWRFPPTTLGAGQFLVVFASGQARDDHVDSQGHPHANFQLSGDGEYLALVEPDGTSISSQFRPAFPQQFDDVAFGLEQQVDETVLVGKGHTGRLIVPDSETGTAIGLAWTGRSEPFDDGAWITVATGIGFDRAAGSEPTGSETNMALGAAAYGSAPTATGLPASHLTDGDPATFTHPLRQTTAYSFEIDLGSPLEIGRMEIVNRGDGCCPERLTNYRVSLHDDDEGTLGPAVWAADIRSDGTHSGVGGSDLITAELDPSGVFDGQWIRIEKLDEGKLGFWPQIAEVRVFERSSYVEQIDPLGDIGPQMLGQSTSAYLRLPFRFSEDTRPQSLSLRMLYDDGFVAYLNGIEIARRNAREGSPSWDDSATRPHTAHLYEEFAVPVELLRDGDNLLAVHALNAAAGDMDLLIIPELLGRSVTSGPLRYLLEPTPGAANGSGVVGFVGPTTFDVERGFYEEPFDVTIRGATPGSTIVYTTDGSLPSATNGIQVAAAGEELQPLAVVPISRTTTLRAVAIRQDHQASPATTHSYLFLEDVLRQPALPENVPPDWNGFPADYAMDPQITAHPVYGEQILEGLRSIPTLSLVTDPGNLWDSQSGIYVHSTQRGKPWERPVSAELILPDGATGFQVDAGLRMWGTGWAPHTNSPKHSFQLKFKDIYGPGKLEYPLFPDAPVARFDDIVLRAQGSRSWLDIRGSDIAQAQYLRDAWARDTARDMGKLDGHATFVHLYLNGLYWGLYNPVERTNEQFAEEYFGGSAEDYDIINRRGITHASSGSLHAWNEMMALADAGLESTEAYAAIQQYLDVDDLIDYMLLQQYATNHDGPDAMHNNMRAIRHRSAGGRFTFHVWDMEYTLWYPGELRNILDDIPDSGMHLFHQLRANPDFRQRFADRAVMHLTGDGALTPARAAARWNARAEEIETAILGESARWGDVRREEPYTRDREWMTERNRLMDEYFPARTAFLIQQLKDVGLFPETVAPQFDHPSGAVPYGTSLDIDAPFGIVYFTTDGTDPRLPGGGVSPASMAHVPRTVLVSPGEATRLLIPQDDSLGSGWTGGDPAFDDSTWSALSGPVGFDEAPDVPGVPVILRNATADFSQIDRPVAETIDGDLMGGGWALRHPVDFQGPVIRAATAVFEAEDDVGFAEGTRLTFTLTHSELNGHNLGRFRVSVTTDDRPTFADGLATHGDISANWTILQPISAEAAGSSQLTILPDQSVLVGGEADRFATFTITAVTPLTGITGFRLETLKHPSLPFQGGPGQGANGNAVLSEFAVQAAPARLDHLLAPATDQQLAAAMQGQATTAYLRTVFTLADLPSLDRLQLAVRYSDGFVAYLNGHEIARRNHSGPLAHDATADAQRELRLALHQEVIDVSHALPHLASGTNVLAIHAVRHAIDAPSMLIAPELIGEKDLHLPLDGPTTLLARALDDGQWSAVATAEFRLDHPLRISEVNYHPSAPTSRERAQLPGVQAEDFEFIELANVGDREIALAGFSLTGAVEFAFPGDSPLRLAPGQRLLVVRNPTAFQLRYGSEPQVAGVFLRGRLDNAGERIVFLDPAGESLQDFFYGDSDPWPIRADGFGSSLELADPLDDPRDPANWRASVLFGGSPGSVDLSASPTVILNEWAAETGDSVVMELYNATSVTQDVSGWFVSSPAGGAAGLEIPRGTIIPPRAYAALSLSAPQSWGDSSTVLPLWLIESDRSRGEGLRFADAITTAGRPETESAGRWPSGDPQAAWYALDRATIGSRNQGPRSGEIIISEVHFVPTESRGEEAFEQDDEHSLTPVTGQWIVGRGQVRATPPAGGDAIAIFDSQGPLADRLEIRVSVSIPAESSFNRNAAILFDYRGPKDFKYVSLHAAASRWRIGQRDAQGWNPLAQHDAPIPVGRDVELVLEVRGSHVRLLASGAEIIAHDFGEPVGGGLLGLGTIGGEAGFDDFRVRPLGDSTFEFIELLNTSTDALNVSGWRLDGAVSFTFPEGTLVGRGQTLVVVGFDPQVDSQVQSFREVMRIDETVPLVGPFSGHLPDGGGRVRLVREDAPAEETGAENRVDQAVFGTLPDRPAVTAERGPSLHRSNPASVGDFDSAWIAEVPSPGRVEPLTVPADLDRDGRLSAADIDALAIALASPATYVARYGAPPQAAGDLDRDGDMDFDDIRQFAELIDRVLGGTFG
jgi:hypothetical protein